MSPHNAILFDFDGVLINSLPVMKLSFAAALREVYPDQRFDIDALFEEYCKYLGMGFPEIMSKLELSPKMFEPFRRHSRYLAQYVTMFDGAIAFLDWCYARGFTMGIATGKDYERTIELLEILGIRSFFSHVYASDRVQNPKPAPEMALRFAADTGFPVEDIILIGDAQADMQCGNAAGCQTAAALWGYTDEETLLAFDPTFVFQSPQDAIVQMSGLFRHYRASA